MPDINSMPSVDSMIWGGTSTHNGNGLFAHSGGSTTIHSLNNYLEEIEIIADLLAAGIITSDSYFKLKTLLRSTDLEVRQLGLKFISEKSKLEI
jgi:hypothetical protein